MNLICGHGYDSARIMLVGDAGSEEDVSTGKAISGYTDSKLRDLYKRAGIADNDIYRTLYIKERGSQVKWEENIPLINDNYKNILVNEINTISPNIIVPLGELSFNFLTQHKGIYKFRGSILPALSTIVKRPTRVIPTLGPAPYLNQDPKLSFITLLDFNKINKYIDVSGPIIEEGNIWVCRSSEALRQYFERQYTKSEYLVFDIETYYGIPTCCSFCFDGMESVTVPFLDWDIPLDTRVLMVAECARVLASKIPKVNQNIKYDWKKCERWGFKIDNVTGDTIIAASCLYPEFPKNLGFLTSIYTEMPYFKDEGKEFDPTTARGRDKLYLYCAKDSLATHRIYKQQKEELVESGTQGVYNELMKVYPIYKRMDERGIRIDMEVRSKLIAKYESLFDIHSMKAGLLTNRPGLNPLSAIQVREIIYEDLQYKKVRGVKTTKTGLAGTDEESIEMLLWMGKCSNVQGPEILRTFIACRKLHKVLEYLETPIHADDRMRTEFNLAGTENGRTSASSTTDSHFYVAKKKIKAMDLGRSFQTITKHGFSINGETYGKDIRSMFVPSHGYSFVECDLSQAEARVDAVLAKDFDILKVFDGPIGIHRLTGSWLYDCPPEEIQKGILVDGVDRYHEAKTARHAGERNMQGMRLMMMINRPLHICEKILQKFHSNQPNIRQVFHYDIREVLRKDRSLRAPNGRKRDFYGKYDEVMVNEGISTLPQMIVSDQMKFAFAELKEKCPYVEFLAEAHDGVLMEVPSGKESEAALTFKTIVERPIDFRTCSLARDYNLVIPMEAEWSDESWQNLKKLN